MSQQTTEVFTPEFTNSFGEYLKSPLIMIASVITALLLTFWLPFLFFIITPVVFFVVFTYISKPYTPALRTPVEADIIDPTTGQEDITEKKIVKKFTKTTKRFSKGAGAFFIGYERKLTYPKEVWVTLNDLLQHSALFGTTGAGKTEALFMYYLQAVINGSGNIYMDGKAATTLAFVYWSLARRFGREEDVYIINFIGSGNDKYEDLVSQEHTAEGEEYINPDAQSNSMSLFNIAPADFTINFMQSMLPKVSGDSANWQESAKSLLDGLIRSLAYKRARGEIILSKQTIRDHLSLRGIVNLYNEATEENWHKEGYSALETYLSNLSGFNMEQRYNPEMWPKEATEQHGFRSMQFLKMLNLFTENYPHIFPDDGGDVNMADILHNKRFLLILIPALGLSEGEKEALGNMFMSLIKMEIQKDGGHTLEEKKEALELADRRYFGFPFICIFDELAQYKARGLASLFALIRSLKYAGVIGAQDYASMEQYDKGEAQAVMGNTRLKNILSIEDMESTYRMLEAHVGEHSVAQASKIKKSQGLFNEGFVDEDLQVRDKSRINPTELKGMKPGENLISFMDKLIRSRSFFIPDEDKKSSVLQLKLNNFIAVESPIKKNMGNIFPELQERKIIDFSNVLSNMNGLWESLEKIYNLDEDENIKSVLLFEQAYAFFNELEKDDSPCFTEKPSDDIELL